MKSEAEIVEMFGQVKGEMISLYWVKDQFGLTPNAEQALVERTVQLKLLQDILGVV